MRYIKRLHNLAWRIFADTASAVAAGGNRCFCKSPRWTTRLKTTQPVMLTTSQSSGFHNIDDPLTRRDFVKLCILATQKTLRVNSQSYLFWGLLDSSPVESAMSNSPYNVTININMNADSIQKLLASQYTLYGYKAVQSTDKAGRPLVWFGTQSYSTTTVVSCSDAYQVYTSSSPIVSGEQITVGFSTGILCGQTLQVLDGGVGPVVNTGNPGDVSIANQTTTEFTCGIMQEQIINGNPSAFVPYCAFPLNGLNLQEIRPLNKILLMFATAKTNTGTVVADNAESTTPPGANGPGIIIDFSAMSSCTVTYDVNLGWDWDDYAWAQQIPANENLTPWLIE
ncbi:MAG: hypothetical protein Q8L79_03595 [Methylobacter sp.]|uniref:hypothetical protein n=1 Tax=Methylobacter sp. TaxID=2051955 RepID=UPI00272FB299|nr:hypothetical protein [Methylobacter sp.]MDP1664187.1 hypothetical protein [Methylobacter sp.]